MAFHEYGNEHENQFFDSGKSNEIRNKIWSSFSIFRFFGSLVDVYLTKMFSAVLEMGKDTEEENTPPPNQGH
ncbi:MAG: hypothetical protein AAGG68_06980 [Bacteroidota bacterium]